MDYLTKFVFHKLVAHNKFDKIETTAKTLFELSARDYEKTLINFADYKNKFKGFLITNVASNCALAKSNFTQLTELQTRYKDNLQIFAFLSRHFSKRIEKLEDEKEIVQNLKNLYKVDYPIFSDVMVNGPETHDVFKFLRYNSELLKKSENLTREVPWVFSKFLVDRNGQVFKFYDSMVEPLNMVKDIDRLLK